MTASTPPARSEVLFYHLTRSALEPVVVDLLTRSLARGWRVLVRVGTPARVGALSEHLWRHRDESFLPHGTPDDGFAARQPIYLTAGADAPNEPDVLMLVDRAAPRPEEMTAYRRLVVLFDDADAAAVAEARALWKTARTQDCRAVYWAQEADGRWVQRAESG